MRRSFAVAGALLLALVPFQQARTADSSQFWIKLRAKDKFERSVIADTGVSIEAIRDDFVTAIGNLDELNRLERMNLVESSFPLDSTKDFPPADSIYHNYDEVVAALRGLEAKFPHLVRVSSIGRTVQGRDILVMRVSGDPTHADNLPALITMGGHHAREHLSVDTPLRIWTNLLERYAAGDERVRQLIDARDIHHIPAVNPDGLEYDIEGGKYKMWRKNRAANANGTFGVDLNRNYSHQWGTGGSSNSPSSDTYMGPAPFSEPETRAIRDYVEAHENISTLLSFHTFSKLILYPWGHKHASIEIARDKAVHEIMARRMAQWNGYEPKQASDLYVASGDTTDWAYGVHKMIAFTFELDPDRWSGRFGFYPGATIIDEAVAKNTEPILYLLEHADNPYRVLE